jgi:hypothetical protein
MWDIGLIGECDSRMDLMYAPAIYSELDFGTRPMGSGQRVPTGDRGEKIIDRAKKRLLFLITSRFF